MAGEIKLERIGVVMLGVADLARSVPFYRDALGLSPSGAFESFAFFSAGPVMLALRQTPELGPPDDRRTEIVFSVDDVDAAYQSLKSRGVTFRVAPRPVSGPQYAADFRDPDGHVLSIFGPRKG